MAHFRKSIGGDFDRIDLSGGVDSEWLTITMSVGHDVERVQMVLRSHEAVRDLHYALGRYLALQDRPAPSRIERMEVGR